MILDGKIAAAAYIDYAIADMHAAAKWHADQREAQYRRIEAGEECPKCAHRKIERHELTALYVCDHCQHGWMDLR